MEHLKKDLGQLKRGATVIVTLRQQANVLLLDSSNYRTYAASRGGRFKYTGGLIKRSPARLTVPADGHWYLAIDLGGAAGRISATVAVEPPPRGNLPEYRSAPERSVSGQVSVRRPLPPDSDAEFDGRTWDVFLSHASEDKASVALPLAQALQDRGVSVWLDKPNFVLVTASGVVSIGASAAAASPPSFSATLTSQRVGHSTNSTA